MVLTAAESILTSQEHAPLTSQQWSSSTAAGRSFLLIKNGFTWQFRFLLDCLELICHSQMKGTWMGFQPNNHPTSILLWAGNCWNPGVSVHKETSFTSACTKKVLSPSYSPETCSCLHGQTKCLLENKKNICKNQGEAFCTSHQAQRWLVVALLFWLALPTSAEAEPGRSQVQIIRLAHKIWVEK